MFSPDIELRLRELEAESLRAAIAGTAPAPTLWREEGVFKGLGLKLSAGSDAPLNFVASEESPDRLGDVIEAAGWVLDNFKRNPVFMLAHERSGLPIGAVTSIGVEGKQLLAQVKFDSGDPKAVEVRGKYERGFMKGVSVGFGASPPL